MASVVTRSQHPDARWFDLANPSAAAVVAGPDVRAGRSTAAMVEMIDVGATLLEVCGAAPSPGHLGRSLTALLGDPDRGHRTHAFSEGGFSPADVDMFERSAGAYGRKAALQLDRPELVGRAICVRSATHTYVWRECERDELYDRVADPQETCNRIDDPVLAPERHALRDSMLEWLATTSDVLPRRRDPRLPPIPHGWRETTPAAP